jgi:hypothetical protein
MDGDEVRIHSLFSWNDEREVFEKTGELTHCLKLIRSGADALK